MRFNEDKLEELGKELCRDFGTYLSSVTITSTLSIQKTKPSTRERNRIQPPWRQMANARQEIGTLAKPPGVQEQTSFSLK